MTQEQQAGGDAGAQVRGLLRAATRATLATCAGDDGAPYASLVMLACDYDAAPILLLSGLAQHTRNLAADARVSLLVDGTAGYEPPLTGPRASITGRAMATDDAVARQRYLARYRDAADYADFGDFAFYRVAVERAHLVAGFGRIVWVAGADILLPAAVAGSVDWEAGVIAHMNADHHDAIDLYATVLLGASGTGWQMVGCDPDGCDLWRAGRLVRLPFATRVADATGVRTELVRLVNEARSKPAVGP